MVSPVYRAGTGGGAASETWSNGFPLSSEALAPCLPQPQLPSTKHAYFWVSVTLPLLKGFKRGTHWSNQMPSCICEENKTQIRDIISLTSQPSS